jgi:hypothetical protein
LIVKHTIFTQNNRLNIWIVAKKVLSLNKLNDSKHEKRRTKHISHNTFYCVADMDFVGIGNETRS